ncbi:MAG: hypothetical protein ACI35O_16895 [Bacillaceae bacterium]
MFSTESALVKIWARNVKNGNYTREQVPKLSNLREMVFELLDQEEPTPAESNPKSPEEQEPTE